MSAYQLHTNNGIHPDNISWDHMLHDQWTDVLAESEQWIHYASSNCHYFVHKPTQVVISGIYGYHGFNFWNDLQADPIKRIYSYTMAICTIKMILETLQYLDPTIPTDSELNEIALLGEILEHYKISVHD